MAKSPNVLKIFSTFFIKRCRNRVALYLTSQGKYPRIWLTLSTSDGQISCVFPHFFQPFQRWQRALRAQKNFPLISQLFCGGKNGGKNKKETEKNKSFLDASAKGNEYNRDAAFFQLFALAISYLFSYPFRLFPGRCTITRGCKSHLKFPVITGFSCS